MLDLGSGRGAVTIALAESSGIEVEIVAGDVSEEMLSRLRAVGLPRVDVKYIDATTIDEPDSSFDVVICAFVLHFLAGRAQALAEVARVLRPGGVLAMSVPGGLGMQERVVGKVQLGRRPLSRQGQPAGPSCRAGDLLGRTGRGGWASRGAKRNRTQCSTAHWPTSSTGVATGPFPSRPLRRPR